jgi:hypothetical protein
VYKFQVMIPNNGIMKYDGKCENVKFQMGDSQLKSRMFTIDMGGYDVVL